jgi:hypothetical protein
MPRTQLDVLAAEVLPQALGDLASRQETAEELVQFFEDKYAQARGSIEDTNEVEEETHSAIAETLLEIHNDIQRISQGLEQMLSLESTAITTITHRINTATARMALSEEQYSRHKLKKVRVHKSTKMVHTEACRPLAGIVTPESTTFDRYSINRRLGSQQHMLYPELQLL